MAEAWAADGAILVEQPTVTTVSAIATAISAAALRIVPSYATKVDRMSTAVGRVCQ